MSDNYFNGSDFSVQTDQILLLEKVKGQQNYSWRQNNFNAGKVGNV